MIYEIKFKCRILWLKFLHVFHIKRLPSPTPFEWENAVILTNGGYEVRLPKDFAYAKAAGGVI